jgi:hypothetical protein
VISKRFSKSSKSFSRKEKRYIIDKLEGKRKEMFH